MWEPLQAWVDRSHGDSIPAWQKYPQNIFARGQAEFSPKLSDTSLGVVPSLLRQDVPRVPFERELGARRTGTSDIVPHGTTRRRSGDQRFL